MPLRASRFTVALLCSAAFGAAASGAVTVFAQNLAGFDAAAGSPPIVLDFDSIAADTDIGGASFAGIAFQAGSAPLIVVAGADTFTPGGFSGAPNPASNKLLPTSGRNVLSPGGLELAPGPNPSKEDDDITLVFDEPVSAFGFDHLSQSLDGVGFTTIALFNDTDLQLLSISIPISSLGGGGAPGGADFWGVVSTAADIKRVVINEQDGNSSFPDCNIGMDTIRLSPPPCTATADLDGDGLVGGSDLGLLLVAWGTGHCKADLSGDGVVDGADLGLLLGAWSA